MAVRASVRGVSGLVGGALLAPLTGLVSWVRRGRVFHPTGTVFSADVQVATSEPAARAAAERLAGPALVRWSSAVWKHKQWPDVLGCAVRFTQLPFDVRGRHGDQDLLFATIRRPWTMLLSPLTTDHRDYFANDYYAVSPFHVAELGRVEWRLRATGKSASGASRAERLLTAVVERRASLTLEYAAYRPPYRIADQAAFKPLARIELRALAPLNQDVLRFDPFRAGRGIEPIGFIHSLRKATYATSRLQPHAGRSGGDADELG